MSAKKNRSHQIIIDVAFIYVILNFNDILIVDFSKIQFNNVMDHDGNIELDCICNLLVEEHFS